MKLYELTYLAPPGLSEEEQKNLSQRVVSYMETQPEKQQGNYFWVSFDFYTEPEKIKALEEKLKDESLIQRYMILKKKVGRAREIKKLKPAKPKVELKEIEKKLDEILRE